MALKGMRSIALPTRRPSRYQSFADQPVEVAGAVAVLYLPTPQYLTHLGQ